MKEGIIISAIILAILLIPNRLNANNGIDADSPIEPGEDQDNISFETYLRRNLRAFLDTIQWAEGTFDEPNPYAVTYAYAHVIKDFSDHPANTGEWKGEVLPDQFCINAGFNPGCKSTAAGAYQINRPTWEDFRNRGSRLKDFSPENQDICCERILRAERAYEDSRNGRIDNAIDKLGNRFASFPTSTAGQGGKSRQAIKNFYQSKGGLFDYELNDLLA